MASTALSGQSALLSVPDVSLVRKLDDDSSDSPESFQLPLQLKIAPTNTNKRKGTGSGILGNGMDVVKVAEVC